MWNMNFVMIISQTNYSIIVRSILFRRLSHPREMEDLFSLSDYLSVVMYSPISPYELYFVHKINGIRIYLRNGIKTLCYLEHLNDPWVDLQPMSWLQGVDAFFFLLVLVNQWPVPGGVNHINAYLAKYMHYSNRQYFK